MHAPIGRSVTSITRLWDPLAVLRTSVSVPFAFQLSAVSSAQLPRSNLTLPLTISHLHCASLARETLQHIVSAAASHHRRCLLLVIPPFV
jgi:hypothetical protein